MIATDATRRKVSYGKYQGEPWYRVPSPYIITLLKMQPDSKLSGEAKAYLRWARIECKKNTPESGLRTLDTFESIYRDVINLI